MTPQEIFDTVAKHLITQGQQSQRDDGTCLYRGPGGLKCAVGVLIPDDVYTRKMELDDLGETGNGVHGLLYRHAHVLPGYFSENVRLLSRLQNVHDLMYDRTSFARPLFALARDLHLDPHVVLPFLVEESEAE